MNQSQGRQKIGIGFGLMCGTIVLWAIWMHFTMSPMLSMPLDIGSATSGELDAAIKRMGRPGSMFGSMLLCYAVNGIGMIGGMVLTAMGLIEYADAVRRHGQRADAAGS